MTPKTVSTNPARIAEARTLVRELERFVHVMPFPSARLMDLMAKNLISGRNREPNVNAKQLAKLRALKRYYVR